MKQLSNVTKFLWFLLVSDHQQMIWEQEQRAVFFFQFWAITVIFSNLKHMFQCVAQHWINLCIWEESVSQTDMALWRTSLTTSGGIWVLIKIKHVQKDCINPFSWSSLSQYPAGFPRNHLVNWLKRNCYAFAFIMLCIWPIWLCLLPHTGMSFIIFYLNTFNAFYRTGIRRMQGDSKVLQERGNGIEKWCRPD